MAGLAAFSLHLLTSFEEIRVVMVFLKQIDEERCIL